MKFNLNNLRCNLSQGLVAHNPVVQFSSVHLSVVFSLSFNRGFLAFVVGIVLARSAPSKSLRFGVVDVFVADAAYTVAGVGAPIVGVIRHSEPIDKFVTFEALAIIFFGFCWLSGCLDLSFNHGFLTFVMGIVLTRSAPSKSLMVGVGDVVVADAAYTAAGVGTPISGVIRHSDPIDKLVTFATTANIFFGFCSLHRLGLQGLNFRRCLFLFHGMLILLFFRHFSFQNLNDVILTVAEHFQVCFELLLVLHSLGLLAVIQVDEDVELAYRDLNVVRDALHELFQVLSVRDALLVFKCIAVGVFGFFYCGSVTLIDLS